MSRKVIPLEEIWSFFNEYKDKMKDNFMQVIEIPDENIEVYMTEEYSLPYYIVEVDGVREFEARSYGEASAEEVYRGILTFYGIDDEPESESSETEDDEPDDSDFSDDDYDRIEEIEDAAKAFVEILLGLKLEECGISLCELSDLITEVERKIAEDFGYSVCHPTILEDIQTGEKKVVQFPFDSLLGYTDE